MKNLFVIFFFLSLYFQSAAQTHYYYSHTEYTYGPYYFDQSLGFVNKLWENKQRKEARKEMQIKMKKKVNDMRDYYKEIGTYPDKIGDGWHSVVVLAGDEFIADRKVLVENNKITRMIWDNWMDEELTFSGPIIKAKSAVKIVGGKGAFEGLLEILFMNNLDDGTRVDDAPLEAGKVTFWCSEKEKELGKIYIKFEDATFGPFNLHHDYKQVPACHNKEDITVYYKPGIYNYRGVRKPTSTAVYEKLVCEGTLEITENGCTLVEIYNRKKKRK